MNLYPGISSLFTGKEKLVIWDVVRPLHDKHKPFYRV